MSFVISELLARVASANLGIRLPENYIGNTPMTCDRNNPCRTEFDRHADLIATRLDRQDPSVGQLLLEASGIYNPQRMNEFVANVQRRENPNAGDNLEVARDGRLLISKIDQRVVVLPIDASGNQLRQGARGGPGTYRTKQEASAVDYVQRGVVGAITGAAISGNRGRGAIEGGAGAVAGRAVKEATGQEGATGAVIEAAGACGVGAIIGGKDGCKNGAIGSAAGQALEWLTKKKKDGSDKD